MRSAENSPFTPGYGVIPKVWAGRGQEFHEFDDEVMPRLRRGVYEQARLVTGDRGVGKTVFLAHLEEDAAAGRDWPVRVTARRGEAVIRDLLIRVAETLAAHDAAAAVTGTIAEALRRMAGVRLGPGGVQLEVRDTTTPDAVDRGRGLADLLEEAARVAQSRDRVLVLLLDEVQNADDAALGDLCHALQHSQTVAEPEIGPRGERLRRHLPLAVYLAGLPGLTEQIRRAGATFLERVAHLDFGLLRDPEVRDALTHFAANEGVAIDADALDAMVAAVGGYPYFLHVVGKHVWTAGDADVIHLAEARRGIDAARIDIARFYGERLRGLGDAQFDWLSAAALLDSDDRTAGKVAAALDKTSDQLGWAVSALTAQGLIRPAPGRGRFQFALPGLDAHLRGYPWPPAARGGGDGRS